VSEVLDRILLDGLLAAGFAHERRAYLAALDAISLLDRKDRRSIRRAVGCARTVVARPPHRALPKASQIETLFGLLVTDNWHKSTQYDPSDLANELRHRALHDPASLASRITKWRSSRSFASLKAFDRLPGPIREALNRNLESSGHPRLSTKADLLTRAKAVALAVVQPPWEPLDRAALADLAPAEVETLVDATIESSTCGLYESPLSSHGPFGRLVAAQPHALHRHLPRLARAGAIDPPEMFWQSGEEPARQLQPWIEHRKLGGLAKEALCWTRHVPSIEIAKKRLAPDAGAAEDWRFRMEAACGELQNDGMIRELGTAELRRIAAVSESPKVEGAMIPLFAPSGIACPGCGHDMPIVFDLDLRIPELANVAELFRRSPESPRIRVTGCAVCAYYHEYRAPRVFGGFDLHGGYRLVPNEGIATVEHDQSYYFLGLAPSTLGIVEHLAWPATTPGLRALPGQSHLGGFPHWDQYPDIPTCIGCSRAMVHLGTLSMLDFMNDDPTIYSFICPDCCLSTLVVQTT